MFLSVVILLRKAICPGVLNDQDLIGVISQSLQATYYIPKKIQFSQAKLI
jgi:hypothetical protein